MDIIFSDYILYYKARMQKREGDPVYPNSYLAEKAMYELVISCSSMDELMSKKEAFIECSTQNAVALVKDQETLRQNIYEDCKEFIYAEAPVFILEQIDAMRSDADIVTMVNNVHQKNSIKITVDQLMGVFYSDFTSMEQIEVYQQAEVPDEWKSQCAEYAHDVITAGRKNWIENELPSANEWQPGWKLDYRLLYEDRHRRLIPVNNKELEKMIVLHKIYKTA